MHGRHPMSRLLSGWNQMFASGFETANDWRGRYKSLTEPFEDETSLKSLEDGKHGLSFVAFVRFLMSNERIKQRSNFNAHWKSIFSTCLPCTIDYKYVTRQESTYADAATMMKLAKIDNVSFQLIFD